jgi:hypothetical protein
MLQTALAAGAGVVSLAFALSTLERWLRDRRLQELAWTVALVVFTAAAACLWLGAADRWSGPLFRVFYLLGAVVDVPVLALGTVALLGGDTAGRRAAVVVLAFCAFAAGVVTVAPWRHAVPPHHLPRGSDVFGALPRVLAAVGSAGGALVVLGGAAWSALRRRRVVANVLIAAGTVVLGAGGVLNSALGAMNAFSISLLAGITLLFAGFLVAAPLRADAAPGAAPFPPARAAASQRS